MNFRDYVTCKKLFDKTPQVWPPRPVVPAVAGIYAIFFNYLVDDMPLEPFELSEYMIEQRSDNGLIYIGKAEDSLKSRLENHFDGENSGESTLRRSLGALFKLTAIPRGDNNTTNYCFEEQGEVALSTWMQKSLGFTYDVLANPAETEKGLIEKHRPPLNIQHNPTPWQHLKDARATCQEQARARQ